MRRVIFCRAQPDLLGCEVRASANPVVTRMNACAVCPAQQILARNQSLHSGTGTGSSRAAHPDEGRCCRAGSLVRNAFPRLRASCRGFLGIAFRRHVAPVRRHVTLTLHGRNAKKNFGGKNPRASITLRHLPCNVAQITAKFPHNPAVSDAVDSLNDCMMLNTNLTTEPHRWLTAARVSSRHGPHRDDAPLPPTIDGGTR
jgi:hypothetical protein